MVIQKTKTKYKLKFWKRKQDQNENYFTEIREILATFF